jgi:NAD(P)-dependent dehydrogenase (short-subunit alcohol dehydrogenase family)
MAHVNSLEGKVVVMTGATSGLGKVAALDLLTCGAEVTVLYRNEELAQKLSEEAGKQIRGKLHLQLADLSSFESVINACRELEQRCPKIDMLVNNAAVWSFQRKNTADGFEETLQVNVLSLLLMTMRLMPLVKKSEHGVVINTASALHQGTIRFEDIEFKRGFSSFLAYRQSKLGVILLTRLLASEHPEGNPVFVCQHPGLVDTGLVRGGGWFAKCFFRMFGKTPQKGAETLISILRKNSAELVSGAYYKKKVPAETSTSESRDMELAKRFREVCLTYLKPWL